MPLLAIWKRKEDCFKLGKQIMAQVEFEIGQIDQLLEAYADLFVQAQQTQPGLVETTALASVLHSFYNGLENIFLAIAKGIDGNVPSGDHWHRRLLTQMTEAMPDRAPVLKVDTARRLADYLGFRHF